MAETATRIKIYTAHVCPYCQRVESWIHYRGLADQFEVVEIDISSPRPEWFLKKTGGTTSVPVFELPDGTILKESLVLLRFLEDRFPSTHHPADAAQRAILNMFISLEDSFIGPCYRFLMNTDKEKRHGLQDALVEQARKLDAFLRRYSPENSHLFSSVTLAEAVYGPFFQRFSPLLSHYENWDFPKEGLERFLRFRDAALALPSIQIVPADVIIKAYYDYAYGIGVGKLVAGRTKSSFALPPPYSARPLPPKDKWSSTPQTDAQLGLMA